ncbi:MAG: hypothetical protein MUC36_04090 [Planctomycetes bacterium]|jgi:hypothetical protein|nr:hypothetical protein [Planctomycetota bacterium]
MVSACRSLPSLALAVLWLSAIVTAQAPAAIELREVARTTAFGGTVARIVVAADETRFLGVGEFGDILWWDLGRRELLRRFEPVARYITAVAIHPSGAWAAVAASAGDEGPHPLFAFDLANGDVRQILTGRVGHLAFSTSGEALGVLEMRLSDGHYQQRVATYVNATLRDGDAVPPRSRTEWERWANLRVHFPGQGGDALGVPFGPRNGEFGAPCVSHRGVARGECKAALLRRLAPEPASWSLAPHLDTRLERAAITDAGTMLAADLQGQLFVQGSAAADFALRSSHRGETHALTFSPDGRFLAVQGLGAVRFVDLGGTEVRLLEGTHLVQPGADGADFWILGRKELCLWNASTGRELGERRRWQSPALPLLRTNERSPFRVRPFHARGLALRGESLYGPCSEWTLHSFLVVDGQPWVSGSAGGGGDARPMRLVAGQQFEALSTRGDGGEPVSFLSAPEGKVLFATGTDVMREVMGEPSCAVEAQDREGRSVALWRCHSAPVWLALAGDVVLVGTIDGTVHRLRGSDLGAIDAQTFTPPLLQLAAFDRDDLLATNGPSLQLLDATSLEVVQTLPLPAGFDGIDVFALAPDRRHVALARGSDVRILAIE